MDRIVGDLLPGKAFQETPKVHLKYIKPSQSESKMNIFTSDLFFVLLFGLFYVGAIVVILYFVIKKAVKDALRDIKNEESTE